jgi:predicted nucleotidyltransferase
MQKMWTAESIIETLSGYHDELRDMGVIKLGVFGSYAHGDDQPNSDIDFVVTLNQYTLDSYMNLKFFLEDLFGRPVDLAITDTLKPRLRDRILSEAIYVEGLQAVR